ncbi:MAG: glycoside hydrolase family 18 protein [bacterium]|nr:glycoside hydrolase family 18 protein [bacterium]
MTLATSASPSHIANLNLPALAAAVDFINVMCYDFAGAWADYTYFNAPLFFDPANPFSEPFHSGFNTDAALDAYIAAGVPRNQLVVGMPFYGVGFGNVNDTNNGLYQTFSGRSPSGTWENGYYDYWDLRQNYVNQNGYTRYYHPISHVPYFAQSYA